jgi:hypothetical protein
MPNDLTIRSGRQASRRLFRFGLKSIFILMTILCIWLGIHAARDRRAREMVAINHAVFEALAKNATAQPKDAYFVMSASIRQSTASFIKKSRLDSETQRRQIASLFNGGRLYATSTFDVPLNVEKALSVDSPEQVSRRLLGHYENGLAEAGLKRSLSSSGESSMAIWEMPDHGLSTIIDVVVSPERQQARVRTIFIQNDQLSVW